MSEYQFYEFRSIDRPLTAKEQQEIGRWSSRTYPTATGATFIYNYGDFSRDPKQVVGQYFDAMFYIANWGTTWLMFRFPQELLDHPAIQSYCTVDGVSLSKHGKYVVLEMRFSDEEGYGWIDGEGYLSSLIGLRQDILKGDYRSLYLAWLHACSQSREWTEFDTTLCEPRLSCRLTPFNGALQSLIDLVHLDQDLVTAASTGQAGVTEKPSQDITAMISLLSETEKDHFLQSLLNDEPLLSVKLRHRLQALSGPSGGASTSPSRRTIGEIFQEAERSTQQRQGIERRKREEKQRQKLLKLEADETTLWENVSQHISEKKPKAYDAAILILKNLLLLAEHRGTQTAYEQRIRNILKEYSRLSSLKSKIVKAKLLRASE